MSESIRDSYDDALYKSTYTLLTLQVDSDVIASFLSMPAVMAAIM